MKRHIITLQVEDAFYQEFHEQGATSEELLQQLRLDLEDQLEEYDFQRLMTQMLTPESQTDVIILTPKNTDENLFV